MTGVILFGTGSPIVIDFEESRRANSRGHPSGTRLSVRGGAHPVYGPAELGTAQPTLPRAALYVGVTAGGRPRAGALRPAVPFPLDRSKCGGPSPAGPRTGTYINAGCSLGGQKQLSSFRLYQSRHQHRPSRASQRFCLGRARGHRRGVRSSASLIAAGALARPHIANAAATTANGVVCPRLRSQLVDKI